MRSQGEARYEVCIVDMGGGRFRAADVSLGLNTTTQTKSLKDRAMFDGDP